MDDPRSLAILAASGVGMPHDLGAALRHLQQAAEHGCRSSQAELAALVGNWRLVGEIAAGKTLKDGMPERLRAAVDLAAWRRLPEGEAMSAAPRIAMVRKFISAPICDWLIRLGAPHLQSAEVFDVESGRPEPSMSAGPIAARSCCSRAATWCSLSCARASRRWRTWRSRAWSRARSCTTRSARSSARTMISSTSACRATRAKWPSAASARSRC